MFRGINPLYAAKNLDSGETLVSPNMAPILAATMVNPGHWVSISSQRVISMFGAEQLTRDFGNYYDCNR